MPVLLILCLLSNSHRKQYPFEPLQWRKETLVLDFKEAQNMLRGAGETIDDIDDFSTAQEKKLGKLVAAKYATDFYIIDQYPATVRPFYTMPNKHNPVCQPFHIYVTFHFIIQNNNVNVNEDHNRLNCIPLVSDEYALP
jgi:hypothetical protein